jgi:hypothetical protein
VDYPLKVVRGITLTYFFLLGDSMLMLPDLRQRNQRRLTLEMLSANPPNTAVSAATGRTKNPWMC